ncbi:MAG: ABC transporter permease [Endomicrobium sp.]|jgi:spermidine/putrescine transport system permease protein|nr:ABC transporter permease [Endomicrobium sp.]
MTAKNANKFQKAYLIICFILMYLPISLVIIHSFNSSRISSIWGGFTFDWYSKLFKDRQMFEFVYNSLILGILSSLSAAVIGTLGAFGMSSAKIRGAKTVEYLSILPIMIPEIILGMVFLSFFSFLSLPFGMLTLVIAHTAFCIPYVYLLVKARLAGMDKRYIEAARDLGAGEIRVFWDIVLPLVSPAILSGMFLAFAMSFDDVIISVFVTGVNSNTLPIKIYSQLKVGISPKINALCALLFFATVILSLISAWFAQKRSALK